jgi:hypothetical protein
MKQNKSVEKGIEYLSTIKELQKVDMRKLIKALQITAKAEREKILKEIEDWLEGCTHPPNFWESWEKLKEMMQNENRKKLFDKDCNPY